MKVRATLYHGADECWTGSGDDLLSVLMKSNDAMARERQGRKGLCDGGEVWQDGVQTHFLQDEHWVKVSIQTQQGKERKSAG